MNQRLFLLAGTILLGGCAGREPERIAALPPPVFAPAMLVDEEPAAPDGSAAAAPDAEPAVARMAVEEPVEPLSAVAEPVAARDRPERVERQGSAVRLYAYAPGTLYRLAAAPERVSEIALQPGETLLSVAAGDTARWVIADAVSGSGESRRTHVLVKPSAPGLKTNLVIATDRRIYHVEAESSPRTAMTSISWSYPDALVVHRRTGSAAATADRAVAPVSVEGLDFGYAISGDDPPWRPVRAFDDGRQVFIEFPPSLGRGEAPPLFVLGTDGQAELVNYRIRGSYYVVDRLFRAAELRLGGKRQQVVRIVRTGGRP